RVLVSGDTATRFRWVFTIRATCLCDTGLSPARTLAHQALGWEQTLTRAGCSRSSARSGQDRVDVAAVDAQCATGRRRRQWRRQVGDHVGDLLGLDEALDQRLRPV